MNYIIVYYLYSCLIMSYNYGIIRLFEYTDRRYGKKRREDLLCPLETMIRDIWVISECWQEVVLLQRKLHGQSCLPGRTNQEQDLWDRRLQQWKNQSWSRRDIQWLHAHHPPPFLFLIVMLNFCIGWKLVIVLAVGVTHLLDNKYCCGSFHLLCY